MRCTLLLVTPTGLLIGRPLDALFGIELHFKGDGIQTSLGSDMRFLEHLPRVGDESPAFGIFL